MGCNVSKIFANEDDNSTSSFIEVEYIDDTHKNELTELSKYTFKSEILFNNGSNNGSISNIDNDATKCIIA